MHFPLQLEQKAQQQHRGCPSTRTVRGVNVKPKVWPRENSEVRGSEVFTDRVGVELEVM